MDENGKSQREEEEEVEGGGVGSTGGKNSMKWEELRVSEKGMEEVKE